MITEISPRTPTTSRIAVVALGSNLGDRWARLRSALDGLRSDFPDLLVSEVFETEPVGGPPGQDNYLNMVVTFLTDRSARSILTILQRIESEGDRVRSVPAGPRTIDLDLIDLGGEVVDEDGLTLPHPRVTDRPFVIGPLLMLDSSTATRLAPVLAPAMLGSPELWAGDVMYGIRRVGPI
ncbi:MAG: 2-amino-4-hydroxy-6-hydroxymethyldihydropteridine diphosphokinase [Acidimicrobiaceae bacterium]|nr:2-amino-4-hydroxy-6-hydroxymethyldihydropteridine diphosphokinase [Acidimicrobiaceae bacterium]